jgi:hypothetical protein
MINFSDYLNSNYYNSSCVDASNCNNNRRTGNQGYQGHQGSRGYQGNQGLVGVEGTQGAQGYTGAQGGISAILPGEGLLLTTGPSLLKNDSSSNNITSSSIATTTNTGFLPTQTVAYDLGSQGYRWRSIYTGPGTINIQSATNPNNSGTIGTDDDGIVYTQTGFATPFINIGPQILVDKAVGGWKVGSLGIPETPDFDLIAQENTITGVTGPQYSLIRRV